MQIIIDDKNYHLNIVSDAERRFANDKKRKLYIKYPKIQSILDKYFASSRENNNKKDRRRFYVSLSIIIGIFFLIFTLSTRTYVSWGNAYHTKNTTALYLIKYKELPPNYVVKSYYTNSSLRPTDGKYIGGDIFRYEGAIKALTNKVSLRECDLDYNKDSSNRGTYRLVYTSDCSEIFYTDDHYQSFSRVTSASINGFANTNLVLLIVLITGQASYCLYLVILKKRRH